MDLGLRVFGVCFFYWIYVVLVTVVCVGYWIEIYLFLRVDCCCFMGMILGGSMWMFDYVAFGVVWALHLSGVCGCDFVCGLTG